MTNGEKIINTFHGKVSKNDGVVYFSTDGWIHAYADEWWNAEYKELTTKNDLGVDCISREQALEPYKILENTDTLSVYTIRRNLAELPSVTPQEPRKGHWIWCVGSHKCSNCEEYTCFSHKELLRYCPNCGAKMVEPQESEDKE